MAADARLSARQLSNLHIFNAKNQTAASNFGIWIDYPVMLTLAAYVHQISPYEAARADIVAQPFLRPVASQRLVYVDLVH